VPKVSTVTVSEPLGASHNTVCHELKCYWLSRKVVPSLLKDHVLPLANVITLFMLESWGVAEISTIPAAMAVMVLDRAHLILLC
jgi:hypothetical protein